MNIFILEDDFDRRERMRSTLEDRFVQYAPVFCETASGLIRILESRLSQALCISLDHDLDPSQDEDGRMVADWLAARQPVCPVIIHSSNGDAAVGMQRVLCEAGWSVYRSFPGGDLAWIADDWRPTLRAAIMKAIDQQLAQPGTVRTQ